MKKDERGELIVEASIVMVITIVILGILISFGGLLYQKHNLYVVANETANEIAMVYPSLNKDPFTAYMNPNEFYNSNPYRRSSLFGPIILNSKNMKKAKWFAYSQLSRSKIWSKGEPEISVTFDIFKGYDNLMTQIKVTIKEEYNVPLLKFFGIDGKTSCEVTAYADCVDVIDYMSTIRSLTSIEAVLADSFSDIADAFVKAEKFFGFVQTILKSIFD